MKFKFGVFTSQNPKGDSFNNKFELIQAKNIERSLSLRIGDSPMGGGGYHDNGKTFGCLTMSIICLGPTGAGKTLLLKKLQNRDTVDETSCTISTTGSNLTSLKFLNKETGSVKEYEVRELGGTMAPIWHKYYAGVNKVIYVVDASNLCQISASGILLFSILADPQLLHAKVLIVLTKMDVSYRQMRNEALLMLQMKRLQEEVPQQVTILESSAVSGEGVENIAKWIQGKLPNSTKVLLK